MAPLSTKFSNLLFVVLAVPAILLALDADFAVTAAPFDRMQRRSAFLEARDSAGHGGSDLSSRRINVGKVVKGVASVAGHFLERSEPEEQELHGHSGQRNHHGPHPPVGGPHGDQGPHAQEPHSKHHQGATAPRRSSHETRSEPEELESHGHPHGSHGKGGKGGHQGPPHPRRDAPHSGQGPHAHNTHDHRHGGSAASHQSGLETRNDPSPRPHAPHAPQSHGGQGDHNSRPRPQSEHSSQGLHTHPHYADGKQGSVVSDPQRRALTPPQTPLGTGVSTNHTSPSTEPNHGVAKDLAAHAITEDAHKTPTKDSHRVHLKGPKGVKSHHGLTDKSKQHPKHPKHPKHAKAKGSASTSSSVSQTATPSGTPSATPNVSAPHRRSFYYELEDLD